MVGSCERGAWGVWLVLGCAADGDARVARRCAARLARVALHHHPPPRPPTGGVLGGTTVAHGSTWLYSSPVMVSHPSATAPLRATVTTRLRREVVMSAMSSSALAMSPTHTRTSAAVKPSGNSLTT